jgi:hypothetical protein
MNVNIMYDLETWGTTPGSDIRSIGACVFVTNTRHGGSLVHDGSLGTIKPFYIACDNPEVGKDYGLRGRAEPKPIYQYPLTRDPRTVQWWSEQSEEAQAAFADPVDLREALVMFGKWLVSVDACDVDGKPAPNVRMWSHGSHFDAPILAAAYQAVGLPQPWHYRSPRDTRTIFEAAGMDVEKWYEGFAAGTHHHALNDAIAQAKAVCHAYKTLGIA